ncbi:MAG TPA: hypothetical protein VFE98_10980 [Candidatus Bathyarchaeia archaeon]|nr:hypothetical protein [Candidatus Bathyarchaeia archaeon]
MAPMSSLDESSRHLRFTQLVYESERLLDMLPWTRPSTRLALVVKIARIQLEARKLLQPHVHLRTVKQAHQDLAAGRLG